MASVANFEQNACSNIKGLTKRQIRMCRRNVEHMDSVKIGAQLAIFECQYQFRNRRWNCSVVQSDSVFGKVLKFGEKLV